MKVCLAIEKFDPALGGAERYCWDLAHYLAARGHTLAIICMRARAPEHASIQIHRVKTLRFPQGLRHASFALQHHRLARSMPDYLHYGVGNTFFMDVYQPHGGLHKAWFVRESLRYNRYVRPLKRLVQRCTLKDMVQRGMEWWIFTRTRPQVIAISDMVARDIKTGFDYPCESIAVIPNGIDTARYTPARRSRRIEIRKRYGLAEDDFVFCFVANNFALKGFYVLVDACISMRRTPFKVLVIGAPDYWAKAEARLVSDTIVFGGRASDLEDIYPACDCLVHPSYYDACSLVVLEALASGIPVITTATNGANMFVDGNGRVIPSHDPVALANAMREAYSHKLRFTTAVQFRDSQAVFAEIETLLGKVGAR